MTADHPTREEQVVVELDNHALSHQHMRSGVYACICGIEFGARPIDGKAYRAHVAAALVAADPAPAQPDAALSDGEALAVVKRACDIECKSPGKHTRCSWHEPYRVLRDFLAARAAQPVPAPEVSRGVAEAHHRVGSLCTQDGCEQVHDPAPMSEPLTVHVSAVEWAELLAEAFDKGKWAAYSAERDGNDGSQVPNLYAARKADQ